MAVYGTFPVLTGADIDSEDIPLGSLHTQFNCNFSIVSQTNPHIHLFFFAPRGAVGRPVAHRKGKGWRGGFILSALESYIKLDLSKHFKVIRDLDLLPQILQSDWSGVFLQRFSGDLTLTPRSTLSVSLNPVFEVQHESRARTPFRSWSLESNPTIGNAVTRAGPDLYFGAHNKSTRLSRFPLTDTSRHINVDCSGLASPARRPGPRSARPYARCRSTRHLAVPSHG